MAPEMEHRAEIERFLEEQDDLTIARVVQMTTAVVEVPDNVYSFSELHRKWDSFQCVGNTVLKWCKFAIRHGFLVHEDNGRGRLSITDKGFELVTYKPACDIFRDQREKGFPQSSRSGLKPGRDCLGYTVVAPGLGHINIPTTVVGNSKRHERRRKLEVTTWTYMGQHSSERTTRAFLKRRMDWSLNSKMVHIDRALEEGLINDVSENGTSGAKLEVTDKGMTVLEAAVKETEGQEESAQKPTETEEQQPTSESEEADMDYERQAREILEELTDVRTKRLERLLQAVDKHHIENSEDVEHVLGWKSTTACRYYEEALERGLLSVLWSAVRPVKISDVGRAFLDLDEVQEIAANTEYPAGAGETAPERTLDLGDLGLLHLPCETNHQSLNYRERRAKHALAGVYLSKVRLPQSNEAIEAVEGLTKSKFETGMKHAVRRDFVEDRRTTDTGPSSWYITDEGLKYLADACTPKSVSQEEDDVKDLTEIEVERRDEPNTEEESVAHTTEESEQTSDTVELSLDTFRFGTEDILAELVEDVIKAPEDATLKAYMNLVRQYAEEVEELARENEVV